MPIAKSLENGWEREKILVFNKLCSGKSALIFATCLEFLESFCQSVVLRLECASRFLVCWLQHRLPGTGIRVSRSEAGGGGGGQNLDF